MKRLMLFLILGLASLNVAWDSETGTEVVSDLEVIVRTSLEATQVLTSDTLSLLYGETRAGGATRYASFDSGGTLSLRNVVSSIDTVKFTNNQMLAWVTTTGVTKRIGVSSDNRFVIPASIDATNYNISGDRIKATSMDAAEYKISGTPGRTSVYTVNTGGGGSPSGCTLTFTKGILTSSSC